MAALEEEISHLERVAAEGIDRREPAGQAIHRGNLARVKEIKTLDDEAGAEVLDKLVTEVSFYDAKTGLFNEKYFHFLLDGYFRRLQRAEFTARRSRDANPQAFPDITLAEYDVNNFKRFNDLLGYDAGDELIQGLAECLKSAGRNTDYQFRLHGDEHAVVYEEGTDLEKAVIATRRAQQMATDVIPGKIEAYLKDFPERYRLYKEEFAGRITVSAGIARITPEIDRNKPLFLERLDLALHRAKTDPRDNHIGISVYDPRSRPEPFLLMARAPRGTTASPAIRR